MRTLVIAVLALFLTACGESTDAPDVTSTTTEQPAAQNEPAGTPPTTEAAEGAATTAGQAAESETTEAPPDVVIRAGESDVSLAPYGYCLRNTPCVDSAPPKELRNIGKHDELIVEFPEPDWEFYATFWRPGALHEENGTCVGRVDLERLSSTTYALRPTGPAGMYDINLIGRGDSGDVAVAFTWTTSADGQGEPSPCGS